MLGLVLGVDFTFAWDKNHKKNTHLDFLERNSLREEQGIRVRGPGLRIKGQGSKSRDKGYSLRLKG